MKTILNVPDYKSESGTYIVVQLWHYGLQFARIVCIEDFMTEDNIGFEQAKTLAMDEAKRIAAKWQEKLKNEKKKVKNILRRMARKDYRKSEKE